MKLELNIGQIQIIVDALGNLPHNRVRALIDEIVSQVESEQASSGAAAFGGSDASR